MDSLRVKNFRSINDSGDIEIKPISVFLGKNSCGKSSFVRLFPLLKQTLESNCNEALLWYGDYVDFGSFGNILPKAQGACDSIEIDFDLEIALRDRYPFEIGEGILGVKVYIEIAKQYVKKLTIDYFDQRVTVEYNKGKTIENIIINSDVMDLKKNVWQWIKTKGDILPLIYEKEYNRQYPFNLMYYYYYYREKPLKGFLINEISDFFGKFTKCMKEETKLEVFHTLSGVQSKQELLDKLKRSKRSKHVSDYFSDKTIEDRDFLNLNNLVVLDQVNFLIEGINVKLNSFFEKTYYLKPIRVNAERYYRVRGITIDQVDTDGSNLPMIFYNMTEDVQRKFKEWCIEKFSLYFSVEFSDGHVSLFVNDCEGNKSNLVDAGYGYSQVLPIIVQLWLLKSKKKVQKKQENKQEILLVIEQPELHLHPAFQAKLVNVFVSLIKEMRESGIILKIVFETHSEAMINRLGALVSQNFIDKELVNIILVEKEHQISKFKQVQFTNDGFIDEWPIGFLSAEE